jgi:hypothetical protein
MSAAGAPTGRAFRALASALREAEWLSPERARAWCGLLAGGIAAVVLARAALSHGGLGPDGQPIGTDFVSFWTASRLALDGHPAAAYDPALHEAAQRALFPASRAGYFAFFYPPPYLLICLPLALLPYVAALAAWLGAGFALLATCVRRLLPPGWPFLPIAAFPGVFVNAGSGQNGFLSASCLGGAMLLLDRRPFLAGLCLGGLVCKPHLLVAAPVALLAARRWRAIAGAATSACVLVGLSWAVFGGATWRAFLADTALARATLEQGLVAASKMTSTFAAARMLGEGVGLAYAVQGAVAAATFALLARGAAGRPGGRPEGALLVAATLLCSPFLLSYDLAALALPVAWVAAQAERTGWLPWERLGLLAAYVLPLATLVAGRLGLPIAPLVVAGLLAIVLRRAAAVAKPAGF